MLLKVPKGIAIVGDAARKGAKSRVFVAALTQYFLHHPPVFASTLVHFSEATREEDMKMGSGKPRSNVKRASAVGVGIGAWGGDVIQCEFEAAVTVTVLVPPAAPRMTRPLAMRGGDIVVMDGGTAVAVLDPGEVVDRLRSCMGQGFEYMATLNLSTATPVASVKPRT